MLEAPARVVGAQDPAHHVVTHDITQLLVEQLPLLVDHRVVSEEVTVALADHRHRLAPPVEVPEQDVAFDVGVRGALAVRFKEPSRLKAGEAFVEISLAPLVVGEDPHRVVVAQLMNDEDRKSTRLNSSHGYISYAVFCLKKKKMILPYLS